MQRTLGTLLLALGLLVPLVGTVTPASDAAVAPRLTAGQYYARQASNATNHVRRNHGLRTLNRSACLARKAWAQARRMARQKRMFHQDLGPVLRQCGLSYAGENVAFGYRTGNSVVYQGWMKSPSHRANILSKHYRLIAIGAVRASNGRWYVSQVFGRHA